MNESAQHLRSAKRERKALHLRCTAHRVIEAARFLVRGPPTTVKAKLSGHTRHQARPDRNTTARKRRTGADPAVQEPWGSTTDSKHAWQRSPDGRREDKPDHTTRPGPASRAHRAHQGPHQQPARRARRSDTKRTKRGRGCHGQPRRGCAVAAAGLRLDSEQG